MAFWVVPGSFSYTPTGERSVGIGNMPFTTTLKRCVVSSSSLWVQLCIDLLYRLRPARLPRLKCEKNRIVWFTKLTVLFYLESGWVGGVCWVVASRVFCLKNKRANRILEFANNSISERGFLQFLHWCNFRHVSMQWS